MIKEEITKLYGSSSLSGHPPFYSQIFTFSTYVLVPHHHFVQREAVIYIAKLRQLTQRSKEIRLANGKALRPQCLKAEFAERAAYSQVVVV